MKKILKPLTFIVLICCGSFFFTGCSLLEVGNGNKRNKVEPEATLLDSPTTQINKKTPAPVAPETTNLKGEVKNHSAPEDVFGKKAKELKPVPPPQQGILNGKVRANHFQIRNLENKINKLERAMAEVTLKTGVFYDGDYVAFRIGTFSSESVDVTPMSSQLDQIIAKINEGWKLVQITGYASYNGYKHLGFSTQKIEEKNYILSEQRAQNTKKYLANKNINMENVWVYGGGESKFEGEYNDDYNKRSDDMQCCILILEKP